MRHSGSGTLLLLAGAMCLLAQSAFAVPVCRCDDMAGAPPCHQPAPSEKSACCDAPQDDGVPAGCSSGLESTCCSAAAPSVTEVAVVTVEASDASASAFAPASAPVAESGWHFSVEPVIASSAGPPGPGAWLLHSALLN